MRIIYLITIFDIVPIIILRQKYEVIILWQIQIAFGTKSLLAKIQ